MSILGTVASVAQIGIQSLAIKPKRGLYTSDNSSLVTTIIKQVTIEEVHSDEMEITEHPVEQGSTISDHAYARPSEVIITAAWSDSPNNSSTMNQLLGAAANVSPVLQKVIGAAELVNGIVNALSSGSPTSFTVYNNILTLYNNRRIFDIYTGKRVYKNMLIKSLATTTDAKTENSLILRMTCRQILMAQTQTVTMPNSSAMSNPAQNGSTVNMGMQSLLPSPTYNVNAAP